MRHLHDYRNDDGTPADGRAGSRDDSSALRRALAEGPGEVCLGAGEYRFGDIAIPADVTVRGEGPATVVRCNGAAVVFQARDVGGWRLRDLVVDGEAEGDWQTRPDQGRSAVAVSGCWGYQLADLTIRNFHGAGVQLSRTRLFTTQAPFCNGGNLLGVNVSGCHVGIRFDVRAEYINAAQISAWENVTGVVIHAGNVKIANSNLCSNRDGLYIEDKENGSHGAVSNCLLNHNLRHALWTRQVRNGMAICNCCFFYGDILLEDSQGVSLAESEMCCDIEVRGGGCNRVAGNYIIPHADICKSWRFTAATLVEGNHSPQGRWTPPGDGTAA